MKENFGLYFDAFPNTTGSVVERLEETNTLVFPSGKAFHEFLDSFGDDPQGVPYELWRDTHDKVRAYESAPICIYYDGDCYRRLHDGIAQAMWEFHSKRNP